MISVYQFNLNEEDKEIVKREGYDATEKTTAYADKAFGEIAIEKWFNQYEKVAVVESNDLDETFHILNVVEKTDRVKKLGKLYSLSVGDVLEKDGEFFLVDTVGFKRF